MVDDERQRKRGLAALSVCSLCFVIFALVEVIEPFVLPGHVWDWGRIIGIIGAATFVLVSSFCAVKLSNPDSKTAKFNIGILGATIGLLVGVTVATLGLADRTVNITDPNRGTEVLSVSVLGIEIKHLEGQAEQKEQFRAIGRTWANGVAFGWALVGAAIGALAAAFVPRRRKQPDHELDAQGNNRDVTN